MLIIVISIRIIIYDTHVYIMYICIFVYLHICNDLLFFLGGRPIFGVLI